MDHANHSAELIEQPRDEPRLPVVRPSAEHASSPDTTRLDLIGACVAASFIILPLLAGAVRG